jgi:hypothetical protein
MFNLFAQFQSGLKIKG